VLSFGLLIAMADETELKPLYLICGTDKPKVRHTAARLRQRVVTESGSDLNVTVFDGRNQRAAEVLTAADTAAFAFGTRLLLVNAADKWPAADRDRLLDYLKDPAPATCIALVGETFAKTEKLTKALEKQGQVLRYDVPKRGELNDWVRARAKARRMEMSASAIRHFVALVGGDPDVAVTELDKLAVYTRGAPVTVADIEAVCSATNEARIFELTDAVGRRDVRAAFRCLETLYSGGVSPLEAFYSLLRHTRQLVAAAEVPSSMPAAEVAKAIGVHPFTAKKLLEQRASFDRRSLGRALVTLADAEAGMKGKSQAEPELVLEIALAQLISGR
jgi:DNA polymerase-3 subunit delta